ncbi:MAG: polysaccharide biosynthesis protein [Gammaproteobacteria bacterium]
MSIERIALNLAHMTRRGKQSLLLVSDALLLAFAVWAAYALRLGVWFEPNAYQWLVIALGPLLAIPVFVRLGLYRSVIRYMGEHALWSIVKGMAFATLLLSATAFMMLMTGVQGMPRSVLVLYFMVGVLLVGSSRFVARWFLWLPLRAHFGGRQALIYGAGDAGRQLALSLRQGRDYFPAGFIDEDPSLQGKDVGGVRVYSPEDLPELVARFGIHDVIVTLPSASSSRRREVVASLEKLPVRVRILPTLAESGTGAQLKNMVREVDIGDLLGRDPVVPDPSLLGRCITGKTVLVTGAGGSIGSELCRQIMALSPARLLLLEASEHALYQIDRELARIGGCPVVPCLGSVCNRTLLQRILAAHGVQTVYHAAAHKHVPLLEGNVLEAVRNNVFGTRTIVHESLAADVETFVLISTDKAVRPTNVMGATKRWAELVVQDCALAAAARGKQQAFCAVRFGNVLGSSGSVVPVFKEQIAHGGPVTVTHAEVTRYFMSIHEAVELVIQASSLAAGGEVFLLDMGEPVKIIDLARNMVRLAGHTVRDPENPAGDIEIRITGLRAGEKLYEELLIASNPIGTQHPKIMKAEEPHCERGDLADLLAKLEALVDAKDIDAARRLLSKLACGVEPSAVQPARLAPVVTSRSV